MKIKKFSGVVLLIIGSYLMFNLYKSSLPLIYGTQVRAKIIGTDSVKSKRFTYLYYPVIQFNHQNKTVNFIDKSSSVDKNIQKTEVMLYYDQNYGVSQGFTTEKIVFLVIGILLLLFGLICFIKI